MDKKVIATAEKTSTQIRCRVYSSEPWAFEEVSTRNCTHCKADRLAFLVSCDENILTHKGEKYYYKYIVRTPVMAVPCRDCILFDNSWDAP